MTSFAVEHTCYSGAPLYFLPKNRMMRRFCAKTMQLARIKLRTQIKFAHFCNKLRQRSMRNKVLK